MSKFDECMQPGDKIVHNDGYRVNVSQLKRVAKKSEIKDYITRMVPDIARKCGCKEDEVISAMGSFVADYTYKHFNEIDITQTHHE